MKIKFLGAAGTVTGSSYVLESSHGTKVLIDLGMFQGLPEIEKLNNQPYAYDCSQLDGAILTHAHLDHCGRLPILLPKGFQGDIWMTAPTQELAQLTLLDTAKIAKMDKKKALFDKELAEQTFERFRLADYHEEFQIGDLSITFFNAGHLLGAASILIEDRLASDSMKKAVFSGDLGNSPEKLLQELEMIPQADVVVMESTYGDRLHPHEIAADQLAAEIQAVERNGAALLIPSFALERTQELLHIIKHLKEENRVHRETAVFMDSPMALKATKTYLNYPMEFSDHIQQELQGQNPFDFPGMEVLMSREESEAIHKRPGPKVILAGSGMMAGGRIVGHAAHYLPMKSTRLFFVGFQGEGTLGRQIAEGATEVMIDKQNVPIRATVSRTHSMSSHADQSQLLQWLKHIQGVKKVFLTHGENIPRTALSEKVKTDLGISDVFLPNLNQEIVL